MAYDSLHAWKIIVAKGENDDNQLNFHSIEKLNLTATN